MKDLSYDDEDRIAADVSLHLVAQSMLEDVKVNYPWFIDLTNAHHAAAQSMTQEKGELFAAHGPMLGDPEEYGGVECRGDEPCCFAYPCRVAESLHSGEGIWTDLIKTYPPDWRSFCADLEQAEVEYRARMRELYPDESW